MKISNEEMCKLLNKKYGTNFQCQLTAPNTLSFSCIAFKFDVCTKSNDVEQFAKIIKKIDWVKAYKNSIPIRIVGKDSTKKQRLCLFNQSKKTEVRFLIPVPMQLIIEDELSKTKQRER